MQEIKRNMSSNSKCVLWCLLSFSLSLCFVTPSIHSTTSHQVYIVYLGQTQFGDAALTSRSHFQLLSQVFDSEGEMKRAMLYSYKHSFSGFAAKLNATQATALAKNREVISVFKSKTLKLHTTRSWDFLGLPPLPYHHHRSSSGDRTTGSTTRSKKNITPNFHPTYGDDVIVGMFDTGVWPESESFKEGGYCLGPIPWRWRGECVCGEEFDPATACNRKLIGARYYLKGFEHDFGPISSPEYRSPRDSLGHGTHTASTAVGSLVPDASFFGFAQGTARGGAPRARLAVYKVCWGRNYTGTCSEADIMAAFDDALRDGVNVISASFGDAPPLLPLFDSQAAIGSFHAALLGVTVVFSAGNDGPHPSLVTNVSPWGICVAASSIDRSFPTTVHLNNNFSISGQGLIVKEINGKLAYASKYFGDGVCARDYWLNKSAVGKVILCFSNVGGVRDVEIAQDAVRLANGSALLFVHSPTEQTPNVATLPTLLFDTPQGNSIFNYLRLLSKLPVIRIMPSTTEVGKSQAPVVSYFSSRGPNSLSPDILKPDISAPGENILAAWPWKIPPTLETDDSRRVNWNFQSGTSMSCPHVSGVVALLKSAHPRWSPAAIRSALITTASTRDNDGEEIEAGGSGKEADAFDVGAGEVDPTRAMDPGLVYDMGPRDHLILLCNLQTTGAHTIDRLLPLIGQLEPSAAADATCSSYAHLSTADANYPSVTVAGLRGTATIRRTAREVTGAGVALYWLSRVVEPTGVEVSVWPRLLVFTRLKPEVSYYVTLRPRPTRGGEGGGNENGGARFGEMVWSDGTHFVRTPLVVSVNASTLPPPPQAILYPSQ